MHQPHFSLALHTTNQLNTSLSGTARAFVRRGASMLFVLAISACAAAGATRGSGSGPDVQDQVSDRFYFGVAIPNGGMVSDSAWRVFLRDVVTPAFPEGLTVWRAEGQWLDPRGQLVREPTIVVEVIHARGVPADSVFERIAETYRSRFRQDAVMRITSDVRFRMYEQRR